MLKWQQLPSLCKESPKPKDVCSRNEDAAKHGVPTSDAVVLHKPCGAEESVRELAKVLWNGDDQRTMRPWRDWGGRTFTIFVFVWKR